jgi:hypothetical protein
LQSSCQPASEAGWQALAAIFQHNEVVQGCIACQPASEAGWQAGKKIATNRSPYEVNSYAMLGCNLRLVAIFDCNLAQLRCAGNPAQLRCAGKDFSTFHKISCYSLKGWSLGFEL